MKVSNRTLLIIIIVSSMTTVGALVARPANAGLTQQPPSSYSEQKQEQNTTIEMTEKQAVEFALTMYAMCYLIFEMRSGDEGMVMMKEASMDILVTYTTFDESGANEFFHADVLDSVRPNLARPDRRTVFLLNGGCEQIVAETKALGTFAPPSPAPDE